MKAPLATAVAITTGLIVLAGILLQPRLDAVLSFLLHIAIIIAAMATLTGLFNLIRVHWMRIRHKEKHSVYSFVVIAAFLITLLAGILIGPRTANFERVVTGIQYPIEASLMSLVAVSLAFSSLTVIRRKRHSLFVYLFMLSALFFILMQIGIFDQVRSPIIQMMIDFINGIPVGGIRGLLIGMALGSLFSGIRILTGTDRPYAG